MGSIPTNIDMLPDEAMPALQHAFDVVKRKRKTQRAAMGDLNGELAALGLRKVSYSAFNRWASGVQGGTVRRPEAMTKPTRALPSPEQYLTITISAETASAIFDLCERTYAAMGPTRERPKAG